MLKALFEDTLFIFRIDTGKMNVLGMFIWGGINTTLRLGSLYLLIRVIATAFDQGSFL